MKTLYDVIDLRDGRHYSVVKVKANKTKWFVPATEETEEQEA